MKNQAILVNIRFTVKVVEACFEKFSNNPNGLEEFIDLLAVKVVEEDARDLKDSIEDLIKAKDKDSFVYIIQHVLDPDIAFVRYINRYYELGIGERLSVDRQVVSEEEVLEIYYNLIFMFTLPEDFNSLSYEQKGRIQAVHTGLFGKSADLSIDADYGIVCRSMQRGLFGCVVKYLLPDMEHDLLIFIRGMLDKVTANKSLKGRILGEALNFKVDLTKQEVAEPKIKSRMVSKGLAESEDDLVIDRNYATSSNDTYIVVNKSSGDRYYAKSFSREVAWENTLNPCEMFIYKVMEYMGYGPKTEFLVDPGGNILWDCGVFEDSFILTIDVRGAGQELFLDIKGNEYNLRKFAGGGIDRLVTREFAVEISSMVALSDVVPISDVFGQNGRNYGLVGNPKVPSKYRLQFVDHWPSTNGLFTILTKEEKRTYSPRGALAGGFFKSSDIPRNLSPLAILALESRDKYGTKSIQNDVYQRLFCPQQGDSRSIGLSDAVARARADVKEAFFMEREERKDEIMAYLDEYIDRITRNIGDYCISVGRGLDGPVST